MANVRVMVLRSAGTNCDRETQHAFEQAGAAVERVHVQRWIETPTMLDRFDILALPGGFSYGDDIAAGRILATELTTRLGESLRRFVERGRLVIGICNGFQVLVRTGLLPGHSPVGFDQTSTLAHNTSGRFQARWVGLEEVQGACVWTRGLGAFELPMAHGEGRFVMSSAKELDAIERSGQVALRYKGENPNGSERAIAGVCDASGRVFGLMPHPERYVVESQHFDSVGRRVRDGVSMNAEAVGMKIFHNGVSACG